MFDKKLLETSELYDKRYRNFASAVVLPIFVLFVGFLLFTVFAKKQLTINTTGDIEPVKIIAKVQSTSSNPITINNLSEGKRVKVGATLVKYNSQSDMTQLDALQGQLKQVQNQKEALTTLQDSLNSGSSQFRTPDTFGYEKEFENYQAQASEITDNVSKANQAVTDQNSSSDNERSAINNQINIINGEIRDYQALEAAATNDGAISDSNQYANQYKSYQSQVTSDPADKASIQSQFITGVESSIAQLQGSAQSLNVQGAGLEDNHAYDNSLGSQTASLRAQAIGKANQEMASLDNQIASLKAKVTLQKQANQNDAVLSPKGGVLHVLPDVLGVKAISAGSLLAEIYPSLQEKSEVYIETYVSSADISGIKCGQGLHLTVSQSLPKPLLLQGKITHIDSAPTTVNHLNVYKIDAKVSLSKSEFPKARYGLQGKAVIITGEKTYWSYYLDKIIGRE